MKRKRYNEDTILISLHDTIYSKNGYINDTQYTGVRQNTKIIDAVCKSCHKPYIVSSASYRNMNFVQLCKACHTINTCNEKYGVSNPSKLDYFKEKKKETTKSNYGVENPFQSEIIKEKIIKTNIRKYGMDHYSKTDESKEKHRQSYMKHYGVDNYNKTPESKIKIRQTNFRKYGKASYSQTDECKLKTLQTNRRKYGKDNYSQTDECKERIRQTNLKRYGKDNYAKTKECQSKRKSVITYNNIKFDSKPELEFYKKCIAENKTIIRHPIELEYTYNNKTYSYLPDFLVDGELIEIKGNHFLNPQNNKWWNPFDHTQDAKAEAKYDCAIRNNVKIIYV